MITQFTGKKESVSICEKSACCLCLGIEGDALFSPVVIGTPYVIALIVKCHLSAAYQPN